MLKNFSKKNNSPLRPSFYARATNPPMTRKEPSTSAALRSAPLRLRHLYRTPKPNRSRLAQPDPSSPQPPGSRPITRKCSAEYSPALAHLNPITRATSKPLNSARQSLRSLHFVTLSLRSVGKRCSAEKKSHRRRTPLRSVCATLPGARAN